MDSLKRRRGLDLRGRAQISSRTLRKNAKTGWKSETEHARIRNIENVKVSMKIFKGENNNHV